MKIQRARGSSTGSIGSQVAERSPIAEGGAKKIGGGVEEPAFARRLDVALLVERHVLAHLHGEEVPAAGHRRPDELPLRRAAAPAEDVVPHHLQAALRDRERHRAVTDVAHVVAVGPRQPGVPLHLGQHLLGPGGGAVRRVDVDPEGAWIALEHRQVSGAEQRLVLLGVGRGDGEERALVRERIGVAGGPVDGLDLRQPPGPGRDGAVGVAGPLRPHGREVGSEPGGLLHR